jgi:sulfite reductase (NADPH) hemoprotein beta-component
MVDVIESLIDTYRKQRNGRETFIDAVKRMGIDPFKTAANAVRVATARTPVAA